MSIKLSVVVPCYNEEKRFQNGFNHYYSYLKKQKYSWELIFVNDGSKDNTYNLMQKFAKDKSHVKIVNYKKNKGKGYAIVQGIKTAKGDIILFTDIDHSVPVETIQSFFKFFESGFKAVIGSRRVKGSKIVVRQQPMRELLGRCFTGFVNLFVCPGVTDATCGFKAFENVTAHKIFEKITIYDWAFDAEILFLCKKLNIDFVQAPVAWSDVKGSKVSLSKDILKSALGILKIRLNDINGKYS